MALMTVDTRGKACPQPVIETRQALEDDAVNVLKVLVDNDPALENVTRTGRSLGCEVQVNHKGNGESEIMLIRQGAEPLSPEDAKTACRNEGAKEHFAVLISADTIGRGDDALGQVLMVAFVNTLAAMTPMPKTLIFMNSGVKLAAKGSELAGTLRELEDGGAKVLCCGTCLDFYDLKESLAVGTVSNMFDIISALQVADKTIRP